MVPTFLGITFVAFALVRAAPGQPVFGGDALLRSGTLAQVREYRRLMGLDDPLLAGYVRWLANLLTGNLGDSFRDGRPVLVLLGEALPVTLLVFVPSMVLGYLLAIPSGIVAGAWPRGRLDRAFSWIAFFLYSLPVQWVALVLVLSAVASGSDLPIQGLRSEGIHSARDLFAHLVLPVVCVSYGFFAVVSRYLRASMVDEMAQDYVRTARAKGLSHRAVVLTHALPNSLLGLITLFGLTLPALASGAVIVEQIFGLPGMGKLTCDAVLARDVPVLMGTVTVGGVLTMLGMLVSDLLYAAADPRISFEGART